MKKMSFFDDDPFEDIVSQFFGNGSPRRRYKRSQNEEEERSVDYIESDDFIYVLLEFPGYNEEDISLQVDGGVLEVNGKKKDFEGVKEYLVQRFSESMIYQKKLPENIKAKEFDYSVKNGIIEIRFRRKK